MQRWFALMLGCVLAVGVAVGGLAQEGPGAGDERTISDAEGETLGVVTVEEVQDPFEDYVDGSAPEDGMRYVLLRIAFEATGEAIFDAQPSAILVRDGDGVLWRPTNVQRDDAALPDLQGQPLSPGNRVSGAVTFEVPEASELTHVLYRPDSRRLVTLADLRGGTAADAGPGDEVSYASLDNEGSAAIFSVIDVEDPFKDQVDGSDPEEGMRYVTVTVSVEASGDTVFATRPNEIMLRDTEGFLWTYVNINRGEELEQPNFDGQPLAPGNRISGVLGFQIPEDAEVDQVLFLPSNDQMIILANLRGGSDGVNAEATPV